MLEEFEWSNIWRDLTLIGIATLVLSSTPRGEQSSTNDDKWSPLSVVKKINPLLKEKRQHSWSPNNVVKNFEHTDLGTAEHS